GHCRAGTVVGNGCDRGRPRQRVPDDECLVAGVLLHDGLLDSRVRALRTPPAGAGGSMISGVFEVLWTWTPFLLEGFYWNVVIAVLATLFGTTIGGLLALLQLSSSRMLTGGVAVLVSFFRNVPSLVLLFYVATLIPNQLM